MLIQKWTDQKLEKLVFIFFNVYCFINIWFLNTKMSFFDLRIVVYLIKLHFFCFIVYIRYRTIINKYSERYEQKVNVSTPTK